MISSLNSVCWALNDTKREVAARLSMGEVELLRWHQLPVDKRYVLDKDGNSVIRSNS